MNQTLQTIADRYSCRDFASTPLTEEQVKALAKAALAAPSAHNLQPWRVTIVNNKALIDDLNAEALAVLAVSDKEAFDRFMDARGSIFYNAPAMVLVSQDGSADAPLDCGILAQNVALAAHALGLGSVICKMVELVFQGTRADELRKLLRVPEGFDFGMAVLIGPARSSKAPHPPDFDKVTFLSE
ncbi:MAG: nitroreductase family protein [Micrococcales bacterium]|nr:nitroreductase family protein [Micrococcales bacterium]